MNNAEISVREVVGSEICVATSDGDRVYKRLAASLKKGQKIDLSFRGVEMLTTAFLSAAVGRLYGKFPQKQVQKLLTAKDMEHDDRLLLSLAVRGAIWYYEDPKGIGAILDAYDQ